LQLSGRQCCWRARGSCRWHLSIAWSVTTSVSWPLGRYGFIQALAFLISGLAAIGLAYVIRERPAGAAARSSVRC